MLLQILYTKEEEPVVIHIDIVFSDTVFSPMPWQNPAPHQ